MTKSPPETTRAIDDRRAIVLRNMCDLMRSIGREGFDNPDDWMDSILERPRTKSPPSPVRRAKR